MKGIISKSRWTLGLTLCVLLTQDLAAAPATTVEQTTQGDSFQQTVSRKLSALEETRLPVTQFYRLRDGRPAWQEETAVIALADALERLEEDGLEPSDYRASQLLQDYRHAQERSSETQAEFDITTTRHFLLALEHLGRGKVDPSKLEPQWGSKTPERNYALAAVIQRVDSGEIEAALELARPDHAYYRQLRDGLNRYRQLASQGSLPLLPQRDEALRPGDTHDDVTLLRRRLESVGAFEMMAADGSAYPQVQLQFTGEPRNYDSELERAVKEFQRRHLLQADGVVGEKTRAALNTSLSSRVEQLRVNLERARWIRPDRDNAPHVWVDIAGYRLRYVRPGGEEWNGRVVVGKPRRETPVIHSAITHLTLNPTWTIPPTILREDVLPQVRRDIGYLARENLQVLSSSGEVLDPESINWESPGGIMLRQRAGAHNPLGELVVRFPNDQIIYLHDTPAQGLFRRDQRALSSGCVRVEGVKEFAQLLLEDSGSTRRLEAMLGRGTNRQVDLPREIPVALYYMTAWPDDLGEMEFRPDIYRRDDAVLSALRRPVSLG
ncbi:L,D-transpeptidase family protein [Halomonas sp. Bachu 37]|uniref:L,D-transpeptidase family protein n=1 Tax=Halomonas kashgarensis TaxID=3084920 RepID=UPI003216555E